MEMMSQCPLLLLWVVAGGGVPSPGAGAWPESSQPKTTPWAWGGGREWRVLGNLKFVLTDSFPYVVDFFAWSTCDLQCQEKCLLVTRFCSGREGWNWQMPLSHVILGPLL